MPKHLPGCSEHEIGVIGGTFIEGASTDFTTQGEFDLVLEGARNFYGLHKINGQPKL